MIAYTKADKLLTDKKEECYKKGNISDWKINKDILKKLNAKEVVKNKSMAFSVMFEKESEEVVEKLKVHGYYTNKLSE